MFAVAFAAASLAAIFVLRAAGREPIAFDEVLVAGGIAVIGNDADCSKYEATVGDLYVSAHEITWGAMARIINAALDKKYVEIRNGKILPRVGLFPQYYDVIIEIEKNADVLVARSGDEVACREGAESLPASNISWYGMALFCNALSEANGLAPCYDLQSWDVVKGADGYRMPTFEEWEYAARGGAKSRGYAYAGSDDSLEVGWFAENSGGGTHPVGRLPPNELGLYDMSGNVHEFCTETFKPVITSARTKGSALQTSNRIWRGGSYASDTVGTYYFRQNINNPEYYFPFPDVGLRTVRAAGGRKRRE